MRRAVPFACAIILSAILAPALPAQPFARPFTEPEGAGLLDLDFTADAAIVLAPCLEGDKELQPLPDEAEGFRIPGEFLQVRADDLCRGFDLPLRENVMYRRITVEFDVHLDHWVTPIFHNVSSLRRTGFKKNERILYYGLIIRGDNKKTILDLGAHKQDKQTGPWKEDTDYHFVLTVDRPSRKVELQVFEGEDWVYGASGRMTAREIRNLGGRVVRLDFSSGGVAFHAYYPPTGWTFSNLKVTADPY